jgi:hypothetical protein
VPIDEVIDQVIEADVVAHGEPRVNKDPREPDRPIPWIPWWPWVLVFVGVFIGGGLIGYGYPWDPPYTPTSTFIAGLPTPSLRPTPTSILLSTASPLPTPTTSPSPSPSPTATPVASRTPVPLVLEQFVLSGICIDVVRQPIGPYEPNLDWTLYWYDMPVEDMDVTIDNLSVGMIYDESLPGFHGLIGLNGPGPKTIDQVLVYLPDGTIGDVTDAVTDYLDTDTLDVRGSGQQGFGLCA